MTTLHIRQDAPRDGRYPIRLTLKRPADPDHEAEAVIQFALTPQEQRDLRWYLENYLQESEDNKADPARAQLVEALMKSRGEGLYDQVLNANPRTQALWYSVRNSLADLRVEITTSVAEAASIPWELLRDQQADSPIALRVKSFVRVQSNPNISFVQTPPSRDGRIRLLYIACRPGGALDLEFRAVANRLLQDLGPDRARFEINALRPPTFEALQKELTDAKAAGRPYHLVHFDGHGIYADLAKKPSLASWLGSLPHLPPGEHGYLLFAHSGDSRIRPVDGQTLGQLLHDSGVPALVLNACQSAMHEATAAPANAESVHDEVRAIGSLAQAVVDQGIPAVLGMRYEVHVDTAAQYIGQLYAALAAGRSFGQAATEGRKHLHHNPERWIGLQSRPLQDWFVPIVYEAMPFELLPATRLPTLDAPPDLDPIQSNLALLDHVPETGFIGRDSTLLALDRAFDTARVVLLHGSAGFGKSAAAVEFARWYSITGGLRERPLVFLTSFTSHTDLDALLQQIGERFSATLAAHGKDWSAAKNPAERRQLVIPLLRLEPLLWIWDSVEAATGMPDDERSPQTAAPQNDLRDFLRQIKLDPASQVKILLTSRRDEHSWLGAIPLRVPMHRMTNTDAANLALKLGAERNLRRSDLADWQPLLDYCAGNPRKLREFIGQAIQKGVRGSLGVTKFVDTLRKNSEHSL